ncbi:MAG: anthranilate synthase component [Frankiaceae bacterium]|nr:anthranilate synthase component [Frankiaceae bacterium]
MSGPRFVPDFDAYAAFAAEHAVVPVTRTLFADADTPVGVYRKLTAGRPRTFLLESAEHGRVWSRYSFVGVHCAALLTAVDGAAFWHGDPPPGVPTAGDPLQTLRATSVHLRAPRIDGMPPLMGGLVGYLSYDIVRRLERLPSLATDDLRLPELAMLLATDLAVIDHVEGTIILVANTFPGADRRASYDEAVARLDAMADALAAPSQPHLATAGAGLPDFTVTEPDGGFRAAVETVKEEIRAGEAFQIVVSQRFEVQTAVDPLDVYRALRVSNPSPYMYLLRFDDHDVVGSSPEALVKVTDGRAMLHPIAGSRPRGATPEEDAELAAELVQDPKERSEHVMLVDLGRNDLGRVCRPGSVEVIDFMHVERYSHIMHIVSTVVGQLGADCVAFDVLTACFPAGTLTGAPKPRAMEIIERLEPTRRGLYGGTVGYLDFGGDLDMAIAIRTVLLRDGKAFVQAGAGLVADSVPETEDAECRNKAAAVLHAIGAAERMRPVG